MSDKEKHSISQETLELSDETIKLLATKRSISEYDRQQYNRITGDTKTKIRQCNNSCCRQSSLIRKTVETSKYQKTLPYGERNMFSLASKLTTVKEEVETRVITNAK